MRNDRILVIYAGWLGDLVWIVPTLHALRSGFSRVALVVSRVQKPLADLLLGRLVDEVHADDPGRRWETARRIRQAARDLDVGVFLDLKGRAKTGLCIPWRRGARILLPHRRNTSEALLARLLHPGAVALPLRPDGHMVEAYLSCLQGLEIPPAPVSFQVPFDEQTVAEGERLVEQAGLRERPGVALNLGSAQYSKIWPAGHFRRLAEILKNDLGCQVVIMGARSFPPNQDYDRRAAQEAFGDGQWTCWVETNDFAVDAYLLQSGAFALCVGNDSYAGHMAGSAAEVEAHAPGAVRAENGRWYRANHTVSLFGPTNPFFCRPYDPTGVFNTVVMPERYPDDCVYDRRSHTCPHYGDRHCQGTSHCMRSLSVEQVAAVVEEKLRQIARAGRPPVRG